jgi:hypothetical protein
VVVDVEVVEVDDVVVVEVEDEVVGGIVKVEGGTVGATELVVVSG